ncbi:MAG: FIST C-terminal domain-containing protein [Planctomycetia bacterium]|nr:MAG: FIST C-terminal domain-containing protein [Planctomycetia bacterium]
MIITAAHTTEARPLPAVAELLPPVAGALGGGAADLAILLTSAPSTPELPEMAERVQTRLAARVLVAATAGALICNGHEFEQSNGTALWAAQLPGVRCRAFHFSAQDADRLDTPEAVAEHVGVGPEENPAFILIGDPFSVYPPDVLARLHSAYPGRPIVGGLISAGARPGENTLIFEGLPLHHGVIGVALSGDLRVDALVSQGCRPIGRPLVVTRAERNVIHTLGGRATMDVLDEVIRALSAADRRRLEAGGLLVGCVVNEYQPTFARGDFLIRNAVGLDPETRALAISDHLRTGQTVQFHVRDRESAAADMQEALAGAAAGGPVAGALLFSCNGRGTSLFGRPHHDAAALAEALGSPATAGFSCAGEIGPIGSRSYLHGFTAAAALLRPAAG